MPTCPTSTRLYERGKVIEEDFGPDRVDELMKAHPDAVLWLDLLDPGTADLAAIQAQFGLHPLAIEDAVDDHQRPKLDHYRGHLFLNVYAVKVHTQDSTPSLDKTEISAFVTERALITVHKSKGDLDALRARWDQDAEGLAADMGVGFLLYALLDVVVDGQLAAAQTLDVAMDGTEDEMLEEGGAPRRARMYGFAIRRLLWNLRRAVAPMSGLVDDLRHTTHPISDENLGPYLRDVDDHARRAAELIEMARERINELLEADLNEQSNALNDITRKLAAWAAVIAVPTLITGFFGQNVPFPGYEKWSGFLFSACLLAFSAGGLYLYLKSRRWL
ncbi:magnesium transporter CorA family protein [Actinoplanes sp. NPDC051633]|uniref:magnesium transporter CorA family protein n=1 Tax=Actinoplanes sp. NPDC051633 TaxID=3155670 RepID=UPI00343B6DDB